MADVDIAALSGWVLREPDSTSSYVVVRLTAKSGLKGYGECAEVSPAEFDAARSAIIGRPATSYEAVRVPLGSNRIQAAVNVALLDLVGKFTKAPVYQVLGGPTRNRVRSLASVHGETDDDLARSARAHHASGFRAFMVPLPAVTARNQGQAFAKNVHRRLEALQAAADDSDFVLDGAAALTPGDAGSVAAAVERFHLLWFDEPCRMSNLSAVRKISDESTTPLGFGRYMERPGEAQDALRDEVLDVLRPDLAKHGISQIRRMAALAETYYVAVAPHHNGGPIGTAAALHLAASLPNFFIQHMPVPASDAGRRMRAELTAGSVEMVKDGFASLPAGPGLGIHVNEAALEKYSERAL
jgi:galactonate dehydratase